MVTVSEVPPGVGRAAPAPTTPTPVMMTRIADAIAAAAERERSRLHSLHALDALQQPRRPELDTLARLAAYICAVPTSVINLIDTDRQWSIAGYGCDLGTVSRTDSMCHTSIRTPDVSYTPDAADDPRWATNPHVDGSIATIRLYAAAPLVLPSGDIVGTVCAYDTDARSLTRIQLELLRDIAEQVALLLQLRDEITHLDRAATRDRLTGLPNMTLFEHSVTGALARFAAGHPAPSALFLDLDRFKAINDLHGHHVGDQLLCAVTERLLGMLRGSDLLARRSGDEFLVLADTGNTVGYAGLADRIRQAFTEPFDVSGHLLHVGVSVGGATALPGDTADAWLRRCDTAMYEDKRLRRLTHS